MKVVTRSRNSAIKAIDDYISKTGLGCHWEKPQLLEIKPYKPPRTLEQNAKYHAMCRELAEFVGHTESDIKEYMKLEYGPKKPFGVGSWQESKYIPKGVSQYSKEEASMMIEHLYRIGAELGFAFSDGED